MNKNIQPQMYADKHRLKTIGIAALLTCSAIYGYAQDEVKTENPIETRLLICLDSAENQTTLGMIICCNRAEDEWNVELNRYYKLLANILPADQKKLLKESQKQWLLFRDSEFIFASDMYSRIQGTMYRVEHADRRMEIVRQRAEELKAYYETVKDNL